MIRILCVVVPIVVVGAFFQIKSPTRTNEALLQANDARGLKSRNFTTQARNHSIRNALPYVQQSERQLAFARRSQEAFQSLEGEKFDAFVAHVADMPVDYIGVLSTELGTFFKDDPEGAQQWLFALTGGLAQLDAQERALDLTSYLQTEDKVPDVERKILYDWSETSRETVLEMYNRWAKKEDFVNNRQMAILASLHFNERADHSSEFIDWVGSLDDPDQQKLQATLIEKMAYHAHVDNGQHEEVIELVEAEIENNPRLAEKLPALALGYSPEDPQRALKWISEVKMSDNEMRQVAFAQVMQEMVLNNTSSAAELLSSDDFLTNYYSSAMNEAVRDENGDIRPEARKFYDATLSAFMQGVLSVDPYIVLESADAFYSEDLRDKFRQQANDYLVEYRGGGAESSSHQCDTPDCKH